LATWTQLIVNESQEAFVVLGGVYDGPFGAGRHALETQNLPGVRSRLGLPFGGKSPFSAEVWFVNRLVKLDVTWGTPDPILLQDPKFGLVVPVRAFGQYGLEISDSKRFLLKIVGAQPSFGVERLKEYLAGILTVRIKQAIASAIIEREISVLETSLHLESISHDIGVSVNEAVSEYGLRISQFSVRSINVPENDAAVQKLQEAFGDKAKFSILGTTFQENRSFDILDNAAKNEGGAGQILGAGIGLGIGVPIGGALGQSMTGVAGAMGSVGTEKASTSSSQMDELERAASLLERGVITEEEFQAMKRRILGGD
jgi:membrane protease subunit (stomatin/prohibitin family)